MAAEKIEIPTPLGGLTIPEFTPPIITAEELPELLMAMGIVGITSSVISALGTLISTAVTAPLNFLVMRVALAPLIKGLVPPAGGVK